MWTSAELPDFRRSVFTAILVEYPFPYTYKFLFYIEKKPLIFVEMGYPVYSEFGLLRRFPIVSLANFASFCRMFGSRSSCPRKH